MQLKELEDFLWKKYSLKFRPVFGGNKKLFTLQAPGNPNFFAFLSRFSKHNTDAGTYNLNHIVTLDLNCGDFASTIRDLPGFSEPFRIQSDQWVGLWLDEVDRSEVEKAIDYAYKLAVNQKQSVDQGQYFVLPAQDTEKSYQAQKIPPRNNPKNNAGFVDPLIQKMRESYDYSIFPAKGRSKNFYTQAKIVEDFEDDYQDFHPFKRYFPTYHDMTLDQLRTYFTWRTKVRSGNYEKTSTSYVYVYIYELLNKIGVKDSVDGFKKLQALDQNYVQKYDSAIGPYLSEWMQDYALVNNLDVSLAKAVFVKELSQDQFLQDLACKSTISAEQFTHQLISQSKYRSKSPLDEQKFNKLVYFVWRQLLELKINGESFYSYYIAQKKIFRRNLFASAVVYYKKSVTENYILNDNCEFGFKDDALFEKFMEPKSRYLADIEAIIHEIDRLSRIFYKKGRKLKANNLSPILETAIKKAIVDFHKQEIEAARPKIDINFNDIGKIRQDASITRESLLTDEEKELDETDIEVVSSSPSSINQGDVEAETETNNNSTSNSYDLNSDEYYLLMALLNKSNWQEYIKQKHLMPAILADSINEKLFDEIGDNVIEFINEEPKIIDDYREDLEEMFLKGK